MNIAAILRNKSDSVATAWLDWSVTQVCEKLTELGIGALIVSEDGARVDCIVSERDTIRHLARNGALILDRPVSDIMIREVVVCAREDNIAQLTNTMTDRHFQHLPVVEQERLVGLVSIGDLVKSRIRETEHEAEALKA